MPRKMSKKSQALLSLLAVLRKYNIEIERKKKCLKCRVSKAVERFMLKNTESPWCDVCRSKIRNK